MHYVDLQTIQCFSVLHWIGKNDELAKKYFAFLWMKFSCFFCRHFYLCVFREANSMVITVHSKAEVSMTFQTSLYSDNIT